MTDQPFDPARALASARHDFGEHGGVNPSIEPSTTFTVVDPETMPEIFDGRRPPSADGSGCWLYGRHANPTVSALSRHLAALEGTEAAQATASGMAAITATILALCDRGDRIVASRTIYGGTFALLRHFLPRKTGIATTLVDATDLDAVASVLDATRPKLLYVETIANPTLEVADLPALAELAHARGARLVVDGTFSPLLITPARHGADVVVHSLTKFVGGASDLTAGAICGDAAFVERLSDLTEGPLMLLGPTLDPRVAFTLGQRLPHLALRMAEHGRRAAILAGRLDAIGVRVVYPGLADHRGRETLARIANPGYAAGGILAIDTGSRKRAFALMRTLQNEERFGFIAVSLGYHHTLMSCSASSTSSELDAAERDRAGIGPGLVRISVGYTGDLEDRWEQLERSVRAVGLAGARAA